MTTIYHGYTESQERIEDRMNRNRLADVEATYGADWEATADALRIHIECADTLDWVGEIEAQAAEDDDTLRTMHEAAM
jgi:hypothetical protein